MEHYQAYHPGLKRLSGTVEQQRAALGAVSVADIISIVTASTGSAPTDGQMIGYQASTGNLIWTGGSLGIPSGALAAWGFQRLTNRGLCLRVRRSGDNAESDIGFRGKFIDAAALMSFVGSGSGYVKTIYTDGLVSDLSQTDVTKQPAILVDGAPIIVRYSATMHFDGENDNLVSATDIAFGSQVTAIVGVAAVSGQDKVMLCSGENSSGQINNWFAPLTYSSGIRVGSVGIGPQYNLWDKASPAFPNTVGAVFNNGVTPILGATASRSGWNNVFSGSDVNGFTSAKIRLGGYEASAFSNLKTRGFVVYPTAYDSTGLASVSPALGQYSSGIVIGDSTVATYAGGTEVAAFTLSGADYFRTHGINTIAVPGHTIAQQKTVWQATLGRQYADWVIVQVGLNDCDPSIATATTIAAYQDLITTIRADNATCKIIVATMTPAYERWPGTGWNQPNAQAKWQAINDAVSGLGSAPITGVDARVTSHTPALSYSVSGFPALSPAYDTGDYIHENNAGRAIIGAAWRVALEGLGLT